jgi:hypothetical protein
VATRNIALIDPGLILFLTPVGNADFLCLLAPFLQYEGAGG